MNRNMVGFAARRIIPIPLLVFNPYHAKRVIVSGVLFSTTTGPLLFAHRGASTEWPENSLPALARALDVGADVLEIDVHMTLDGHPVVAHDPDGLRCAGVDRPIAACELSELKTWDLWAGFAGQAVPERRAHPVRPSTLEEVLTSLPRAHFNVDVKQAEPDMVPSLIRLLKRHDACARVLLTSFSAAITARIRRAGYPGPIGMARLDAAYTLLSPSAVVRRFPREARRLQIPSRYAGLHLANRRTIERAHGLGLAVDYWVVNTPASATRLLDLGADGIVTDVPAVIAPVFRRHDRCDGYRGRHVQHDVT